MQQEERPVSRFLSAKRIEEEGNEQLASLMPLILAKSPHQSGK